MISSLRRARIAAVVVLLLSVVYNAPQFAEREAYEETVGCGDGNVRTRWRTKKTDVFGPLYYVVYKTICYVVFRAVGPLLVLLVLNTRLALALNRLGRRRRRLDRSTAAAVTDDDRATSAAAGMTATVMMPTPSTDAGTTAAVTDDDRATSAAAGMTATVMMPTPSTDVGTRHHQRPPATARRRNFQQRQNITLMLVVVVFVFIVCQLPDLGLRITASLVRLLLMLACLSISLIIAAMLAEPAIRAYVLLLSFPSLFFMSPLRRHIFVCFMAKSAFWRGFSALAPYTGVGPI